MVIPKNISMTYKSNMCRKCGQCDKDKCIYEAYVEIEKGQIKSGAMESIAIRKDLLAEVFKQNGPEGAREFLDNVTKLSLAGIMLKGYTIGYSDYEISGEAIKKAGKVLTDAEKDVDKLIQKYHDGKLERLPGKTVKETLEDQIMSVLSKARNDCGRVAEKDLGKVG